MQAACFTSSARLGTPPAAQRPYPRARLRAAHGIRCAAAVESQKGPAPQQAGAQQPPNGAALASRSSTAASAAAMPRPPPIPVTESICMEGE